MFQTIIIILIFLILFIIAFKFFKLVFKIAIITLILIILGTASITYYIYKDINDIKENLKTEENLIILEENNNLLAGISLKKDKITLLNEQTIKTSNYYKKITINTKFLENTISNDLSDLNQLGLSKQDLINILKSNNPEKELLQLNSLILLSKDLKQDINLQDKIHLKSALLAVTFKELENTTPQTIIKEYKKGNIKIEKETITFKLIKNIPDEVLTSLPQKSL